MPRRGSWFTSSTSSAIVLLAVADDVAGHALGRRDQLAVDHQQAVVVAAEEGLDDHRARMLARRLERGAHLVVVGEVDRDAAAVVAVVAA